MRLEVEIEVRKLGIEQFQSRTRSRSAADFDSPFGAWEEWSRPICVVTTAKEAEFQARAQLVGISPISRIYAVYEGFQPE